MRNKRFLQTTLFAVIMIALALASPNLRAADPPKSAPADSSQNNPAGPDALMDQSTEEKDEPVFDLKEATLHLKAGLKWYYQKKYLKAASEFEKAVEINPEYKEAYYYLGYSYYKMGNLDASRDAFNQAYELDSRFTPLPSSPVPGK
ncbi:MAG TPA: tetratricopeptide repeat protein [Nitrospiria bacterium]|nr:tetratricopeptide repeat protein [Nitrospiria bacterium]